MGCGPPVRLPPRRPAQVAGLFCHPIALYPALDTDERRGFQCGLIDSRDFDGAGPNKGREEGVRKFLLLLSERRFGPLPDAARRRVNEANEAQLTQWALDLLSTSRLEDLLRQPGPTETALD